MKVVVTCQPAVGHFHAIAPLALAAVRAGHEVLVVTGRGMGPWVEMAGLPVVEVGPDWLADGPRSGTFDDPRRRLRLMSVATASLIPGLVQTLRERRPDVVLHESLEWAAPLAADAVGLPYAALGQLPRLPRAVLTEVMAGAWNSARSRLGLPPDPAMDRLYPYLYLDAYLPSMQPLSENPLSWLRQPSEVDVAHPVRPPLYQVGTPVPEWLDALPDRPTVYVTMGTAFHQVPHVFSTTVAALREEDVNVVMTVGPGVDPRAWGLSAPNLRVENYIPQEAVLSRADCVVFHAGYLTAVGALYHALPMVAVPVAVDQPYHAHRLAAAGAAIRLDHTRLRPQPVREAVRTLLNDPLYRRNAARLCEEMLAMPPVEHGIELLERLAAGGEPLVREQPPRAVRSSS